jgi:DNA-binding NtrC family response regulator
MSKSKTNGPEASDESQALVYVVDDEAMLLELASVILEPQGYKTEVFLDPEPALRAFRNAKPRPALVITDYAMHSMDGMKLMEECRRIEPNQRVLLVSGTVGADIFAHSDRKPNGFLPKPYHAQQLIESVKSALDN